MGILDIDERLWEFKLCESMVWIILVCALDCIKIRSSSIELSSSAFNLIGEDELDSFVGLCFVSVLKMCLCCLCSVFKLLRMFKFIDSELLFKFVSRFASSSCVNGLSALFFWVVFLSKLVEYYVSLILLLLWLLLSDVCLILVFFVCSCWLMYWRIRCIFIGVATTLSMLVTCFWYVIFLFCLFKLLIMFKGLFLVMLFFFIVRFSF